MSTSVPPPASRRLKLVAGLIAAALVAAFFYARGPLAGEPVSSASLRRAVELSGIEDHLRALDRIASDSDGTRFTGTRGYARSVDYVESRLSAAGLDVERHTFPFYSFEQGSPTRLEIAGSETYRDGVDMNAMLFSASGDIDGELVPVDFAEDGADGPACGEDALEDVDVDDAVVLIRPGPCFYRDQVGNVSAAGAAAVVFAFADVRGDRLFRPTLFTPEGIEIPALAVTNDVGLELADAEGERISVAVDATSSRDEADSVVAETSGGDGSHVVMIGGHLDSVLDGPGINDNGSGVASILELAEELAGRDLDSKVRFAFWGGEEMGLLGSTAYVRDLAPGEVDDIAAYLNFDMVASPNFVRFVYSPEGSPPGSAEITGMLTDYFDSQGLVTTPLDLAGRSDHGPFISVGVPVGGIFTGAEDPKSPEEADLYGGDMGVPHDVCYHQACDTIDNVERTSLDQMADAMAHAVAVLAG